MICIRTQHFNLNRILLLAVGLWPYQKSKFVRFQGILFFGILSSFIIFQLTALIKKDCTSEFVIKVFSITMIFNIYAIKYNMFWINTHNLRNLLEQLQYICNELKDENEIAILIKYGNNTKRYTAIFTLLTICLTLSTVILLIWPLIFGTVLHINESQVITMLTEYVVDREKYFYLILLHVNIVICIGSTTITATGLMILGCIIHICGLFKIASYRMEQAMTTKMLQNINLENQTTICKKIFYAVEIHRKTMKFTNLLFSSFEGSFFLLIAFLVTSLSLNMFGIFHNASLGDMESVLLHLIIVLIMLLYMFVANYAGQEVINYSNHIYSTAYNVRWYEAPLNVQKMILFILQRSRKNFHIKIAGLFIISLECFATLIKASMSYFTFMYSTQ
ncbi:odorant receptor 4-like [Camponotus floridanus]|uniref:odorant receptor 4-like n=1 Tax=Camponotus floridanus TaxID=104421 RepID=UPI000DC6ACD5|nr:odorant receptor 4-like [Camponotus floridanus]